ncbi:hypothetical protein CYMTET_15683 [Cymbomonas tetramitiformis]|uniref:Probable magnesium transporter n=1 Tax=Cymbomonas tetramitiformis TaxID=36881 RepID=A0AAE0GF10_9CHLO|nr:hypothetical protein CYMTET_15683 [Cymbomonas tetramitiformis]
MGGNSWLVGCGINLVGSISINLGTNIMKLGHNLRENSSPIESERPSIKSYREWKIGIVIFVVGNIANFLSFGFAAQSLLASLGTVQFVSNVFFASFVLKERVTWRVIGGTTCIVGGVVILVLFGNKKSEELGVDDLIGLYSDSAYVVYLCCLAFLVVMGYLLYRLGRTGEPGSPVSSIAPLAYAVYSSSLGTQSVLMAKTLSTMLRLLLSADYSLFASWFFYVVIVAFVCTASFWTTRLNMSLKLFPAMIIIPMMQINWTLFSIVSGGMYFQEFKDFSTLNMCVFCAGVGVVFIGVTTLSTAKSAMAGDLDDKDAKAPCLDLENSTSDLSDDKIPNAERPKRRLLPTSKSIKREMGIDFGEALRAPLGLNGLGSEDDEPPLPRQLSTDPIGNTSGDHESKNPVIHLPEASPTEPRPHRLPPLSTAVPTGPDSRLRLPKLANWDPDLITRDSV